MMKQPRAAHVGVNFNNTTLVKARLREEITRLERELETLQQSEQGANFSMLQTYREMIHSRRGMLNELPLDVV